MKKIALLAFASVSLLGCATLGFIDDEKFMSALRGKRCSEAYQMVANSNFGSDSSGERWTYMGQVEYFCNKNHAEGIRLLTKGAEHGDRWARSTLARIGEKIPDDTNHGMGGGAPATQVDVRIIKQ